MVTPGIANGWTRLKSIANQLFILTKMRIQTSFELALDDDFDLDGNFHETFFQTPGYLPD